MMLKPSPAPITPPGTFKEFPPRSFPPSFVPTTIVEQTLEQIKQQRERAAQPGK